MASMPLAQWASMNACIKCRPQFGKILSERRVPANVLNKYTSYSQAPFQSYLRLQRFYSSKTPANASTVTAVAPNTTAVVPEVTSTETTGSSEPEPVPEPVAPSIPVFSGYDIRKVDESIRMKIHEASTQVASAQSSSLINAVNRRRRKEILIMDPSEYEHTLVLKNRPPLWDRLGESESFFKRNEKVEEFNNIDWMCFIQADIDLSRPSLTRFLAKTKRLQAIEEQKFKPKRNQILGSDLAAAHFIVAREGKVKFLGQKDWVTTYRKDAKPGVQEDELPVMRFDLCTLPTKYDPRFRVEAIDAQGVTVYFEGLSNFENLHFLKWLNLRESPEIDDWCLDRIGRMFNETLEYIDISGCKKISDRGIGSLHRCRNLKAIRVENLPHLENLEIVSAMLEDHLPNVQVIGIDYEGKMEQLRLEEQEYEQKALLEASSEQVLLKDS